MLTALLLLFVDIAQAHRLGESYIYLDVTETALSGRFEVALADLDKVFSLDADGDGEPAEQEYRDRAGEIHEFLSSRLTFYHENQAHPIVVTGSEVRNRRGPFALVSFKIPSLEAVPFQIDVEYQYLFDGLEPEHRGLLVIENNPRTKTYNNEGHVALIFGPGTERQSLSLNGTPWHEVSQTFIKHGIWHIWIGFDHILFIVSLLLPSVLVFRSGGWQPAGDLKTAFVTVVKVITLFTIAHSVTLSMSALGIIKLPVRLVEAVIAASIIVVALNNIFPLFHRRIWLVVFGFGLFHGLGFANVLAPLGVERSSLLTALIGFNVGVEIGQLAIVAVVFPILFLLRNSQVYQARFMGLGSAALVAIASFWFIDRAFGL